MNYCPFCQLPLDQPVDQCPSCNADLSEHIKAGLGGGTMRESVTDLRSQTKRGGTLKESTKNVQQQIGSNKQKPAARGSSTEVPPRRTQKASGMPGPSSAEGSSDSALPFRPINRPPTLILCALDDASRDEGEWFRVRTPEFRIGRTEGDPKTPNNIVIANDNGISSIHVEIKLRIEGGRYRYYLRDFPSRNGTFVRVSRAALKPDQDLLIGARRYFLSEGSASGLGRDPDQSDLGLSKSTRGWEALSGANLSQMLPKLVERTPGGSGSEYPLTDGDNALGTDASQCGITITGDPFVSAVHARIFKDNKNRWIIENQNSLNGIWLRIDEMALDTGGEFQIGEQRFLVRIP